MSRLAASVVLAAVLVLLAMAGSAAPPCTHGVSSAGPAVIVDGKLVANPKPHTKACLP